VRSHESRLDKLEREMAGLLAYSPCESCGGPLLEGQMVIILEEGEELDSCPACRGYVGQDGEPLGPMGLTVIQFEAMDVLKGPDPPEEVTGVKAE
jgi:hypothetical protein